ncbi:unnamed protein product [Pleuronectes platessa]|uniref:Uncharacterized protein n=1 Tax=Pleuronectes platessa TaxID=8262 RepID=A0A9N7Z1V8_PLEPL|nr:unnamed protein product [Pleuronectes platessa]
MWFKIRPEDSLRARSGDGIKTEDKRKWLSLHKPRLLKGSDWEERDQSRYRPLFNTGAVECNKRAPASLKPPTLCPSPTHPGIIMHDDLPPSAPWETHWSNAIIPGPEH